jgi:hypothetical protein
VVGKRHHCPDGFSVVFTGLQFYKANGNISAGNAGESPSVADQK